MSPGAFTVKVNCVECAEPTELVCDLGCGVIASWAPPGTYGFVIPFSDITSAALHHTKMKHMPTGTREAIAREHGRNGT